ASRIQRPLDQIPCFSIFDLIGDGEGVFEVLDYLAPLLCQVHAFPPERPCRAWPGMKHCTFSGPIVRKPPISYTPVHVIACPTGRVHRPVPPHQCSAAALWRAMAA